MTNPGKAKGDNAEREVQELLRGLLHLPRIRRALGAGRKDDVGDIDGVPRTAIQVAWRENLSTTITSKLPELEQQRLNRRVPFAALFLRRSRAKQKWIVVMTPEMWAKIWHYAIIGWEVDRQRRRAVTQANSPGKMASHGARKRSTSS